MELNQLIKRINPELRYQQLLKDLDIASQRPFLNGQEKHDFDVYYNYWSTNKIISILNFDTDGNFLPNVYQAPEEILRMQYPIDDIIQYEKRGTLIIDPEQYSPELRKLSFFIYMVDEELFNLYAKEQNYLGDIKSTYMYDRHNPDGIRVFKSYYDLAKHLARKRQITICIGPRATFYMRWYLYEIHEHVIESKYAYGEKVPKSYASSVLYAIKRFMAFRTVKHVEYQHEVTIDNYKNYRQLASKFKISLPDVEEYKSTTMINRYQKQTMHSKIIARIKRNKIEYYEEKLGIKPWHHLLIDDDHIVAYVWDTRLVEIVVPITEIEQKDITYAVVDNRNDLKVTLEQPENVREYLESRKEQIPVQFRYNEPDITFDGSEEQFWNNLKQSEQE